MSASDLIERLSLLVRSDTRQTDDGLLPVHYAALGYLLRANRFSNTLTALTLYLGATKGTVSETLRTLTEKGLLVRTPDAIDKRVVHFALTAPGKRALDRFEKQGWRAVVDEVASPALETALRDLLAALQKKNGGRTFGICTSCKHLRENTCGLTGEPLSRDDQTRICVEHGAAR